MKTYRRQSVQPFRYHSFPSYRRCLVSEAQSLLGLESPLDLFKKMDCWLVGCKIQRNVLYNDAAIVDATLTIMQAARIRAGMTGQSPGTEREGDMVVATPTSLVSCARLVQVHTFWVQINQTDSRGL